MRALLIAFIGAALIATGSGDSVAGQRGGGRSGGAPSQPPGGQRGPQAETPRHPQVRAGIESARRIQDRARDLERHAAADSSVQTMNRDRNRIREQIEGMEKAQNRWRDGLAEQDRTRLREQLAQMEQQRDRLRTHLRDLDGALGMPNPDRDRIRELARDISRDTESLRTKWHAAAQEGS
jgi:predicted nuclease with TOPRIM domain